ncbi:ABC transporter ATP-binding protein [Salinisphaera sp. SPP-AMP-43]|uniref:ABC transporter ATP-binding protein n=1 Tax=Salinisphaera sp. SPP-AMP-43 TaxID=3121288 RepID=UPI003C6E753D
MSSTVDHATQAKLTISGLNKTFQTRRGRPVQALSDIDLSVREGEFVSLLGPSGCGKSTLLRIVAGLDHATSGEVLKDGAPIEGPGADRGMVFQAFSLFPWLTVVQNVEFGARMRTLNSRRRREAATELLAHFGLARFADAYPKTLSGGMKQRVALARALANDPEMLLMDEPFGALDAQTRSEMQEFLLKLWSETRKTVLFVTHDIDEALYLSDRVLVLKTHPGRVAECVDIDLARPRDYDIQFQPDYIEYKKYVTERVRREVTLSDQ